MSRDPKDTNIVFLPKGKNRIITDNGASNERYERGIQSLQNELSGIRAGEPTVNGLELRSLQALIAYIAYDHSIGEDVIRNLVEKRFETNGIEKIYRTDFEEAVAYLVELNPRTTVN